MVGREGLVKALKAELARDRTHVGGIEDGTGQAPHRVEHLGGRVRTHATEQIGAVDDVFDQTPGPTAGTRVEVGTT